MRENTSQKRKGQEREYIVLGVIPWMGRCPKSVILKNGTGVLDMSVKGGRRAMCSPQGLAELHCGGGSHTSGGPTEQPWD